MGIEPKDLHERFGQSIWIDGLRRALVASGELARWTERGVRGVVGNLDQLAAALAGAGDYDDDIRRMVAESSSVREILEELVVLDARSAADALRPVFDASGERDGYVAVDLPAAPADDASELLAEGIRLHRAIRRDNVLVRVPPTVEGCEALTELVSRGISAAAGPIFGPAQHQRASAAHLSGLERRSGRAEAVSGIASIASVEVGAVDAAVARRLRERALSTPGSERDPGRGAALALARRVLADRREIEASERHQKLAASGARAQRIAWSSTAVTDARVGVTRIVDELVARDTVTIATLPTLEAFAERGQPTPLDESEPDRGIATLRDLGVDLDELAEELLDAAASARASGIERLLTVIEARREALLEQAPERQRISLGAASQPVTAALAALGRADAPRRLRTGDATLFGKNVDAESVKSRLGWLRVAQMMRTHEDELTSFARTAYRAGFRKALVLGMGGSSLTAELIAAVFGSTPGFLELATLDCTDPEAVRRAERWADPETTLFVVASKSGTTLEVECFEEYFHARLVERFGDRTGQHFVAITDPGTPLAARAKLRRYARTFLNPADVGGRYSALSYFGLVPAALAGAELSALLDDAARMAAASAPYVPVDDNPGVRLGAFVGALAKAGRDKLTLITSPEVDALGSWVEQLLAESTGKLGRGVIPVAGEPIGAPESYAKDRAFCYLRFGPRQPTDLDRDVDALVAAGFPVARIGLLARHDLGGELFRWQVATAIAGAVLEINPFDEPNVVEAKEATSALLDDYERSGSIGYAPTISPGDPRIVDLVRQTRPGDYVALLAYVDRTARRDQAFAGVRTALRDRLGVATTLGYGPRYLHSTGQLHKGGPSSGVFLVLSPDSEELAIPGKPFGFATLARAQAVGDVRALAARGRRVLHVHLGSDTDAALTTLCRQLAAL